MKRRSSVDQAVPEALAHLVEQSYAVGFSSLEPIHLFESSDRGVYRVDRPDGPPLLLRACRSGAAAVDRFVGMSSALDALATLDYPAPAVQLTDGDDLIAANDDWIVLLLSFVEGEVTTGGLADMEAMGNMLAQLHLLQPDRLREIRPEIRDCRYHPREKLKPWLERLRAVEELVPPELENRYQSCVGAAVGLLAWPELPVSLLHSDCNPQNAIRDAKGRITFIDWDGVGVGPAV